MRHLLRHPHTGDQAPSTRTRRYRLALWAVPAKLTIIALILVLPSELAIGLGAAHGIALLIAGVAAVSLLVI